MEQSSVLVLLAEDETLIAMHLQDSFEDGGFSVVPVDTGEAAIAVLDRSDITVQALITDIKLGGNVDGWAVARHAREIYAFIPVVYMSGDSAHEHTVHGVPESVMLQKPFAAAQALAAIATLLNALRPSA